MKSEGHVSKANGLMSKADGLMSKADGCHYNIWAYSALNHHTITVYIYT